MTTENNNIGAEIEAQVASQIEIVYVRNSATLRTLWQSEKGVGLNAAGTYVSESISKTALDLCEKQMADGWKKVKFAKVEKAIISKGKKGTAVRFGYADESGEWLDVRGQNGGRGVIHRSILGEKGEIQVLDLSEFVSLLATASDASFIRKCDGSHFEGKLIGSQSDKIASCIYTLGGKFLSVDMETSENDYNEKAIGALGGKNKAMAERTQTFIDNGGYKVEVARKRTTATKKKNAKKEEQTEEKEAAKEIESEVTGWEVTEQ